MKIQEIIKHINEEIDEDLANKNLQDAMSKNQLILLLNELDWYRSHVREGADGKKFVHVSSIEYEMYMKGDICKTQ